MTYRCVYSAVADAKRNAISRSTASVYIATIARPLAPAWCSAATRSCTSARYVFAIALRSAWPSATGGSSGSAPVSSGAGVTRRLCRTSEGLRQPRVAEEIGGAEVETLDQLRLVLRR